MSMRAYFETLYATAQLEQHGPRPDSPFAQAEDGTYVNPLVQSTWWGFQNGWGKALSVLAHDGLEVLTDLTVEELRA